MTTTDEARAEAELRFPAKFRNRENNDAMEECQRYFIAGAEWQASRKVEAVPSSAEVTLAQIRRYLERFGPGDMHSQRVIAEALGEILDGSEVAWAPSDTDDEYVPLQVAYDALKAEYAEYRQDMRKRLSRTPQPVQVEITDEMVERAGRVMYASWDEWSAEDIYAEGISDLIRDVLSAALGGGES